MKPLKDLQEISRMLAASPDLPAPTGSASTVQKDVLFNRLEHLLGVGMGLPLANFVQADGVYLKVYFSTLGEDANIFVPTQNGAQFMEDLRRKIVSAI